MVKHKLKIRWSNCKPACCIFRPENTLDHEEIKNTLNSLKTQQFMGKVLGYYKYIRISEFPQLPSLDKNSNPTLLASTLPGNGQSIIQTQKRNHNGDFAGKQTENCF